MRLRTVAAVEQEIKRAGIGRRVTPKQPARLKPDSPDPFGFVQHLTWNPPSWSICAEFWMSNKANNWLGKISYSIYMWQAFTIFNFVDRPVSIVEKITGRVMTTTEGVSFALGGEAGKLIVLGGHVLPIFVTLFFVGFLVAVASVGYYLIERPGQKLFANLSRPASGSPETGKNSNVD